MPSFPRRELRGPAALAVQLLVLALEGTAEAAEVALLGPGAVDAGEYHHGVLFHAARHDCAHDGAHRRVHLPHGVGVDGPDRGEVGEIEVKGVRHVRVHGRVVEEEGGAAREAHLAEAMPIVAVAAALVGVLLDEIHRSRAHF